MVYLQSQGRSRVATPAKARRRLVRWWSARMGAVLLLLSGLTFMVVPVGAQSEKPPELPQPPLIEPEARTGSTDFAGDREPALTPPPVTLPPEVPVAFQDDPKKLEPGPADKLPKGGMGELPSPKAIPPFGPEKVRMPRLADAPALLGSTPRPTEETIKEYNQYIKEVIDPRNTFDVIEGRTRIIILNQTPSQIQVADDSVIGHNLLNPKELIVQGRRSGTTVMTFWFTQKDKEDKILSYLVRVLPDPERKLRLEAIYRVLEKEINTTFPDSKISLSLVGDKVAVSGQAKDVEEATKILRIVRANAPNEANRVPVNNINLEVRPSDLLRPDGTPGLDSFLTAGGPDVINLIRIPGEQQVMLKVTVAEVSRTAARTIGLNFNIINNQGIQVFGQQTGGITLGSSVRSQQQNTTGSITANLPIVLDNGQIPIAIQALKALNYARSLAEPNLVALNGQTASFQSGGSFPVPVLGGFSGNQGGSGNLQGVQFVPYGVQLSFTPVITDRDRIRLQVQATVSTRDVGAGAQVGGTNVPGLNSRNFNTTVEMREGQTLAVAGLIQNNLASETNRVPFWGDIPILNRFAGIDRIQSGEQELVILITPELVHPLEKKEVPLVPGSDLFEPSDLEFFLCGRVEGRRTTDYRSQVMNDIHRMIRYKRCEQTYIFGPVGHTDDPNYPLHPYDRYDSRWDRGGFEQQLQGQPQPAPKP